jgi:hypothetical protein
MAWSKKKGDRRRSTADCTQDTGAQAVVGGGASGGV